jgi:hypothetical protein
MGGLALCCLMSGDLWIWCPDEGDEGEELDEVDEQLDELIHINSATVAQLIQFHGIGGAIAQKICDAVEASPFVDEIALLNCDKLNFPNALLHLVDYSYD